MELNTNTSNLNLNLNQAANLSQNKKIENKEVVKKVELEAVNLQVPEQEKEKKGKVSTRIEELNKSKVTLKTLDEALKDIKSDSKKDDNPAIEDKKKKKPTNIDIKDLNRDGKVTESEKKKAEEKKKDDEVKDVKDLNKDGKVSAEEQQKAKEKKAKSLVKELVSELKKETKEIDEKDFKNISKMINNDIIQSKDSSKINQFLES